MADLTEAWVRPLKDLRPSAESSRRAEQRAVRQEFPAIWAAYPMGTKGKGSKKGAAEAYVKTRLGLWPDTEPVEREVLAEAVEAYAEQQKPGKDGQLLVKHAQTFFGPDAHWRDVLEWRRTHKNGAHDPKYRPPMQDLALPLDEDAPESDDDPLRDL